MVRPSGDQPAQSSLNPHGVIRLGGPPLSGVTNNAWFAGPVRDGSWRVNRSCLPSGEYARGPSSPPGFRVTLVSPLPSEARMLYTPFRLGSLSESAPQASLLPDGAQTLQPIS